MAFNGDETGAVGEAHKPNSYFEAFDGIVAALDALAKAVTPDGGDDGTPPEEGARPCCNSYFASFRNITDALARLKSAVEERIAAGGGIDEESDPVFRKWRDEGYSIGLGKGANVTSNGVAIGWNSSAGAGTGTGSNDSGAVAVGKAAQAFAAFHHQPCDVLEILSGGGVAGAVEGAQEQFARHGGILEGAHGAAAAGQIVELFEGKEGFYLAQAVGRSAVQRDGGLGADGRTLAAAHAVFLVAGAHFALFEAEAEQGADLGAEAAADTALVVDMYHGVFLFFAVRKLPPA